MNKKDNNYEYKIEEKSLIYPYFTKFLWLPLCKLIPPYIKPNIITVIGAVSVSLSAVFIYLAINNNFRQGFLLAALCVIIYMIADNVDGHHARRTNQTSRLGEFLDHWFDSINMVVFNLCIISSLYIKGEILILSSILISLAFFTTFWEYYHTSIFQGEKIGTNEGVLFVFILYILLFFLFKTPFFIYKNIKTVNFPTLVLGFNILICSFTILKSWLRVKRYFKDFIPIIFIIISSIFYYKENIINDFQCGLIILISNSLFCSKFLLSHLVNNIEFKYRNIFIIFISLISLCFLLIQNIFKIKVLSIIISLLFPIIIFLIGITLILDLFKAIKFL